MRCLIDPLVEGLMNRRLIEIKKFYKFIARK